MAPPPKRKNPTKGKRSTEKPPPSPLAWALQLFCLFPFVFDYTAFKFSSDFVTEAFGNQRHILILLFGPFALWATILCLIRRHWGMLWLGFAPYLVFALWGTWLLLGSAGIPETVFVAVFIPLNYLFAVSIRVAFAWFAIRGELGSKVAIGFYFLLALLAGFLPAMAFVVLAITVRFVFLAITQNVRIFREIGWWRSIRLGFKTTLYWAPILLFAVPGWLATHYSHGAVLKALYDHTFVTSPNSVTQFEVVDVLDGYENDVRKQWGDPEETRHDDEPSVFTSENRAGTFGAIDWNEVLKRVRGTGFRSQELEERFVTIRNSGTSSREEQLNRLYSELYLNRADSVSEPIGDELAPKAVYHGWKTSHQTEKRRWKKKVAAILDRNDPDETASRLAFIHETDLSLDRTFRKWRKAAFGYIEKENPSDFEEDLSTSSENTFREMRTKSGTMFADVKSTVASNAAAAPGKAGDAFDGIVPPADRIPALRPRKPAWYDIPGHIAEGVRASIRRSYEAKRLQTRADLVSEVSALASKGKEESNRRLNKLEQDTDALLRKTEERTRTTLERIYWTNHLGDIILNCLFLILCLKSFLYVFARIAFDSGAAQNTISLREPGKPLPRGRIRKLGSHFDFPAGTGETYFVSRQFEPKGRAPRISLPQFWAVFMGRLRWRNWILNRITMEKGKGPVQFSAVGGAEFVQWTLAEGEVVVFDFRNFAAMSKDLRLHSVLSFRISSLLLGRLVFPAATGPGKLILKTDGKPTTTAKENERVSVPPNRLVAWKQDAEFRVESELSFVDVYLSGIYVKPKGAEPHVVDADRPTRALTGLGRFIRYFLVPF